VGTDGIRGWGVGRTRGHRSGVAVEATFAMRVGNEDQWLKASLSRRLSERLFCILFWPLRKGCRRRQGGGGELGTNALGWGIGWRPVLSLPWGVSGQTCSGGFTDDFALKRFLSLSLPLSPSACPIAQKTVWRLTVANLRTRPAFWAG